MDRPTAKPPVDTPRSPAFEMPDGACDAHVHLLGDDFPLWDGRVENPAPGLTLDDWLALYRRHLAALGCTRGVFVHSIFYGTDNSITIEALRRMGPGFKGIGLITDDATEADLDALVAADIKGVRLNYVHGGVLSWDGAKRLAPMLAERGLHIEMLAHSHEHLVELAEDVRALPVDIVFDHCAWPDLSLGLETPGQQALRALLAEGQAWVKLSAPYRFVNKNLSESAELIDLLARTNPERCLWGSDWPHVMLAGATQPDAGDLLTLLPGDAALRRRILVDNPANLYGF